jgi:zinc/manganese transport system permease protein
VGVLLIFALLVTPAAITEHLTARPGRAIALAILFALLFTVTGLFVSFYLPYPVSFFITTYAFFTYLAIRIYDRLGQRARLFHRIQ